MNQRDFEKAVNEQIDFCKKLLLSKGKEYTAADADRLHAFKHAAELQGASQKEALAGMMAKHTVSVYDMCRAGEYTIERWTEKITDSINYLLILRAMVEEERTNKLKALQAFYELEMLKGNYSAANQYKSRIEELKNA